MYTSCVVMDCVKKNLLFTGECCLGLFYLSNLQEKLTMPRTYAHDWYSRHVLQGERNAGGEGGGGSTVNITVSHTRLGEVLICVHIIIISFRNFVN